MAEDELYLVDDREVVVTRADAVRCDGGIGVTGHPVEFMSLQSGSVICKYCGRKFVAEAHPQAADARARGARQGTAPSGVDATAI